MLDKSKFSPLFGTWWNIVEPHFALLEPIYVELKDSVRRGRVNLPAWEDRYKAFEKCPYDKLKVVIIGMDPYPWVKENKIVADGLAFSCSYSPVQPSLQKIFDALQSTSDTTLFLCKDLTYWAEQGVLLLNSSLSVEKNKVGSHADLWRPFMKKILEEISYKNTGIIYWMMGAEAKKLQGSINNLGNYLMYTEHPAAAEHTQRDWEFKDTFNKINKLIRANNGHEFVIDWTFDNHLPF